MKKLVQKDQIEAEGPFVESLTGLAMRHAKSDESWTAGSMEDAPFSSVMSSPLSGLLTATFCRHQRDAVIQMWNGGELVP